MVSGEVKRPTPTTGFVVSALTKAITGVLDAFARKSATLFESLPSAPATFTSHRSGSSASSSISLARLAVRADALAGRAIHRPPCAAPRAQSLPTASARDLDHFAQSRTRFSIAPPYSSLRRLVRGERNWKRQIVMPGIDIDDVEAGALARAARVAASASHGNRGYRPCPWRARPSAGRICAALAGRRQHRLAGQPVIGVKAAMPQFDAARLPCAWIGIGDLRQRAHIVLVPQRQIAIGEIVRASDGSSNIRCTPRPSRLRP